MQRLLVIHGGGPTAVLNSSLYGVIKAGQAQHLEVLGARNGIAGLLGEDFIPLSERSDVEIAALLHSPGTAIGSSRTPLQQQDYPHLVKILQQNQIDFVLMSGGNGTMTTAHKLATACRPTGISVLGIPKTIDNDLGGIDHAPGFLSAANYIRQTVREIAADVASLPIHVCIIELMGRNAGWLTAAAALAAKPTERLAPDLIYVPEHAFDETQFLHDVQAVYAQKGSAIVVVAEGLKNAAGQSIVPTRFKAGRAVYFGEVGSYLAEQVTKQLGLKARNEKPGLAGRASIAAQTKRDRTEAIAAGRMAVAAVLDEQTDQLVGLLTDHNAKTHYELLPLAAVAQQTRVLPAHYINAAGNGITTDYRNWLGPRLADTPLPEIVNFN
ncbi:diphosphate--fructose-6-phosphate 1-phosphotransferase [Loigolactobacillus jiayinensis]|uniref:Pyrophosphate--fructose 6-phosphate 1-phosphotransferase n=1 Tax=Loigolactobacillus jiayinensis TaxID=2486016 RepID=A0ABW1RBB5_9LACO|nr:diphosphate--fructose-6-phosphate 1-phosphotransferase [Loigolactobacillus jiayinensis]